MCIEMTLLMIGIEVGEANFKSQFAALRHSVASVDGEVEKHLFHHARVGFDPGRMRRVLKLESDIFTEQPSQHARHVADHFIEIEATRLNDLAPAKGKQLARQSGSALGSLADLLSGTGGGASERWARKKKRGVPVDDGENVVKVVRDATCELADSLHL